jgi:hypothetical protein
VTIEDRFNLRARVANERPGRYIGLWQIDGSASPADYEPYRPAHRPVSDAAKIEKIRSLAIEWEQRSRPASGDAFLAGMETALHEVAMELKSVLDDAEPAPMVAADSWPKGYRTGVPCPKCSAEIVYNRWYSWSYHCSRYGHGCDWAMSEDDTGVLITRCHEGLLANRASS